MLKGRGQDGERRHKEDKEGASCLIPSTINEEWMGRKKKNDGDVYFVVFSALEICM